MRLHPQHFGGVVWMEQLQLCDKLVEFLLQRLNREPELHGLLNVAEPAIGAANRAA